MMTREEIRKQWIKECTEATDRCEARMKELEKSKIVDLSDEEIEETILMAVGPIKGNPPYHQYLSVAEKIIEKIKDKNS